MWRPNTWIVLADLTSLTAADDVHLAEALNVEALRHLTLKVTLGRRRGWLVARRLLLGGDGRSEDHARQKRCA